MGEHEHEPNGDREATEPVEPAAAAGGAEVDPDGEPGATVGDRELEAALAAELDPDAELEPDDAHDGEPPAPEGPSQKEIEETYKKLDKETERHVKRIAELVGEEAFAMLVGCELCEPSMPGFRWPRPPADNVKEAVRFAIGDRQPENWQPDQYSRRCDACEGLGEVLTGSHVRGQDTLGCLACDSRGWIAIGPERTGKAAVPLRVVEGIEPEQPAEAVAVSEPPEAAVLRAAGYVVIKTGPPE